VRAHAALVPRWLGVGFVHGVMNTDNTSISGETIDYGPCAFLDEYAAGKTFSSIDHGGRYAFGRQPAIALWNLSRFGETLLQLIAENEEDAIRLATQRLERFPELFEANYAAVLRAKLGLALEEEGDAALGTELLGRLEENGVDYSVFFRSLCDAAADPSTDATLAAQFSNPESFHAWARTWRARLARETLPAGDRAAAMRRANPAFIPRNHRIREAIEAGEEGNFQPFEELVATLERPFEDQPEHAHLAVPPRPEERVRLTFCGT